MWEAKAEDEEGYVKNTKLMLKFSEDHQAIAVEGAVGQSANLMTSMAGTGLKIVKMSKCSYISGMCIVVVIVVIWFIFSK